MSSPFWLGEGASVANSSSNVAALDELESCTFPLGSDCGDALAELPISVFTDDIEKLFCL